MISTKKINHFNLFDFLILISYKNVIVKSKIKKYLKYCNVKFVYSIRVKNVKYFILFFEFNTMTVKDLILTIELFYCSYCKYHQLGLALLLENYSKFYLHFIYFNLELFNLLEFRCHLLKFNKFNFFKCIH
jgi:hypothetical protein